MKDPVGILVRTGDHTAVIDGPGTSESSSGVNDLGKASAGGPQKAAGNEGAGKLSVTNNLPVVVDRESPRGYSGGRIELKQIPAGIADECVGADGALIVTCDLSAGIDFGGERPCGRVRGVNGGERALREG